MKKNFFIFSIFILYELCGGPIRSYIGARHSSYVGEDENKLPEGVLAVEYIESTGTQWIDVGIAMQSGWGTILDAGYTKYTSGYCRLFGTQKSGAAGGKSCTIRTSAPSGGDIRMEIYPNSGSIPFDTDRHLFFMNYPVKTYGIDSSMSFSDTMWPMAVETSCYLFGNNGATGYAAARFFGLRCVDLVTGNIEREIIPVRFENDYGESVGAVYDMVRGELFTNGGSGSFIIGPDK